MFDQLKRRFERRRLTAPQYAFLYDGHPDETVSIDCETTSLNTDEAEIVSIGAVKLRGNTVLTSQAFYTLVKPQGPMAAENITIHGLRPKDLSEGIPIEDALEQLLHFIGGRPLIGYYLEYDTTLLNKFLKPLIGINLPNRQIEISALYYQQQMKRTIHDSFIDLKLSTISRTLGIPEPPRHNALTDAIHAALLYQALTNRR